MGKTRIREIIQGFTSRISPFWRLDHTWTPAVADCPPPGGVGRQSQTTQVAWLVQITARGEFMGIYCFSGKNSMEPCECMELSMGSSWDILTQ